MPAHDVGAPSSEASGGASTTAEGLTPAEQAIVAQLVAAGMNMGTAIIQVAGGQHATPGTAVGGGTIATVGHTVDWRQNWPILAGIGVLALALLAGGRR